MSAIARVASNRSSAEWSTLRGCREVKTAEVTLGAAGIREAVSVVSERPGPNKRESALGAAQDEVTIAIAETSGNASAIDAMRR
jgi:hypothetical protein